jgi:hypothetical protein
VLNQAQTVTGNTLVFGAGGKTNIKNISLTIKGSDPETTVAISLSSPGNMFYLKDGANLNLTFENVHLKGIGRTGFMPAGYDADVDSGKADANGNKIPGGYLYTLLKIEAGNTVTLNQSRVTGNYGGERDVDNDPGVNYGGGVFVRGTGKFIMNDGSRVAFNALPKLSTPDQYGHGGGIGGNGEVELNSGSRVDHNLATDGGGGGIGMLGPNAKLTINGGSVDSNVAQKDGGGVYFHSGSFTMDGGSISDNTSANRGGGLFLGNIGSNRNNCAAFEGGVIGGNSAVGDGGGVWLQGGLLFGGGIIWGQSGSSNTAARGVSIYLSGGTIYKSGSVTIYRDNVAQTWTEYFTSGEGWLGTISTEIFDDGMGLY